MTWQELGIGILFAVGRTVAGWAENALKDNKVTAFEVRMLLSTVIRVALISIMIYYGADGFGLDVNAIGASAGGVLGDMIFYSLKKLRTKA